MRKRIGTLGTEPGAQYGLINVTVIIIIVFIIILITIACEN